MSTVCIKADKMKKSAEEQKYCEPVLFYCGLFNSLAASGRGGVKSQSASVTRFIIQPLDTRASGTRVSLRGFK